MVDWLEHASSYMDEGVLTFTVLQKSHGLPHVSVTGIGCFPEAKLQDEGQL